jgi:Sulfotransferase family
VTRPERSEGGATRAGTAPDPTVPGGAARRVRCAAGNLAAGEMADPLFILAAPRSFSSVITAMLGQHPQMFGLPETHLFGDETMELWWARASGETYQMAHGLLRAVAQICFKRQTEHSILLARAWLRRRSHQTSGMVFEELAREVNPSVLIDKSPSVVYEIESMRRAQRFFPEARFIHLVRHPRAYCESVLTYLDKLSGPRYRPRERKAEIGDVPGWITHLASFPYSSPNTDTYGQHAAGMDPQGGWYRLNMNVLTFLKSISADQWIIIRGEDLLEEPESVLKRVAEWLGLRTDTKTVEQMMHPEHSPFARFGPPGARLGNDINFLERPALQRGQARSHSLEGPLGWRSDRGGFLPEVVELSRYLGYQ